MEKFIFDERPDFIVDEKTGIMYQLNRKTNKYEKTKLNIFN